MLVGSGKLPSRPEITCLLTRLRPFDAYMGSRVSLRDIAKQAKVHFTTVGLALRHDPRVSPETAERIMRVARELGYTHDAMLSALSAYRHRNVQRHAGVIACIVTYQPAELETNVTERQLISGITRQAHDFGFGVESFQINAPGMTPGRLNRMLIARGIRGLILTPRLPQPGPMPELDWSQFSTVAIGYSITGLQVHRACSHHGHNIRLALRELRAHGYRRVGLVFPMEIFERTSGMVLGTFLAEQFLLPRADRVEPLIEQDVTKAKLGRWLKAERVDCVILTAYPLEMTNWIRELGYRIPEDLGVCLGQLFGKTDSFAGIDNQTDLLGEAAASFVVSMLQKNECGLPAYPRTVSVEGRWVERPTVRQV